MDALDKKLQKVVRYVQKTPFLSIMSTPEGHGIQEVRGSILRSPCTKVIKLSNNIYIIFYLFVMRYFVLTEV